MQFFLKLCPATSHISRRFFAALPSDATAEFRCERLTGSESGIALFRMNRPQTKNAISRNLLSGFYAAIESVKFDKSVRVVILKSDVQGAFCAGADLKERAVMPPQEVPQFVGKARR